MDSITQPVLHVPRILLASAKPEFVAKIKAAVKGTSWEAVVTPTADTALSLLRAPNSPALLLLDTELPGIGTLQLLAATYSEDVRKFPIVLLADQFGSDWNERMTQGDVDDLIPAQADAHYWKLRIEAVLRMNKMAREVEQLREAALLHAQFDTLTGAYNRESLLTMLFRETDRVQRMKGTLCMILFDIDDFGHWNALFGTAACDELLCQVVMRTRRLLRSYDLLGRAGKDEFAVALPGCSGVNAMMLAERLRQEVFAQPYSIADQNIRLTACFGLSMSRGRSPVVVLRESELALQQARSIGPETIQFFNDEGMTINALELPGSCSDEFAW
jgi:two-component system, cell cycle response regulator